MALALALLPLTGAPSLAAGEDLTEVGAIPTEMHPARRHLDIDPSARRLFEIGQVRNGLGMTVLVRDLDDYSVVGELTIDDAVSGIGGFLSAVDPLRHRLYVVYPVKLADDSLARDVVGPSLSGQLFDEASRTFFGVAVIDTLRLRVLGSGRLVLMVPASPQDRADGNRVGVKALSYARVGDRDVLYLGAQVPTGVEAFTVGNHAVWIHQIDVERLLDPDAVTAVDWSYLLRECGMLVERQTVGTIYRSSQSPTLMVPCRQGALSSSTQPLQTAGIARIAIEETAVPGSTTAFEANFFPISGGLHRGLVAVDPVTERLFVQVDGSTTEAGVWAFDVNSASWIGLLILPPQFAAGGTMGLGIDVSRGRAYAISRLDPATQRANVVVGSTRTEGGQGRVTSFEPSISPAKRAPVVDPMTHRIFVHGTDGYLVLRDPVPEAGTAEVLDPDRNTVNVAEGRGTDVNFIGGVQAYGARIRWVGGRRGVERNVNTLTEGVPSELDPNTGGITPPPPAEGTRDVHLGRIVHTTLSNAEATARATGADRDLENTDADLGNWTNYLRRWGGPDFTEQRWAWPIVTCTDFGTPEDTREGEGFGAVTHCDRAGATVSAVVVNDTFNVGEVVRMAETRARSLVTLDPDRGVVSIAEAEILGLELGDTVGIGRVFSRAETWATGRPKRANGVGAGSRFTRTFEDVWIVNQDGERITICGSVCDPEVVRGAVNRALGVRARIDLPEPERKRARGTPGGFEALIVRDPFERLNETSVNDEADTRRLEVPALAITVFADGRVPSRVVIDLAGVSAESHYGIFLLSQGVPFTPPRVDPPPPVLGDFPLPDDGPAGPLPEDPGSFTRRVADGLRFVFASPGRAARTAALLMVLAAPIVMLIRRRGAFGGR